MVPMGAIGTYSETMTGKKVDPFTYEGNVKDLVGTTKQKVSEQADAAKYVPFKRKPTFNASLVSTAFAVGKTEQPKAGFYRLAPLGTKVDEEKEWSSYKPTDKIPSD